MECLGKLSQNMTVLPADKYMFLLEIALEYNRVRIAEGKVTWQGWLPMVAAPAASHKQLTAGAHVGPPSTVG